MSLIAINTSQNVNIKFNTGSVGERILAFVIDMLIKGAYLLVLYFVFFRLMNLGAVLDSMDNWSAGAVIIVITFPIHIYTLVCESLMEGQTFGKKMVKIKVVKIDGFQASFPDYLIRWVFRIVDFGFFFIPGFISMIVTKTNSRLGDIASGTAVISLKNNINISHTILEKISNDYVPMFPQVISLTDNDVRIIKENFVKAKESQDKKIISKLANKILEILKLNRDDIPLTETKFIDTIIKDYNFYTGKDV